MEIEGIIKDIRQEQQITNTFKKRELIITTEEQYPQHLMVEFVQDKTGLLDNFKPGDKVTVGINLRGREWQSPQGEVKYFNTIQGWRIEAKSNAAPAPGGNAAPSSTPPPMAPMDNGDDDDLPF